MIIVTNLAEFCIGKQKKFSTLDYLLRYSISKTLIAFSSFDESTNEG